MLVGRYQLKVFAMQNSAVTDDRQYILFNIYPKLLYNLFLYQQDHMISIV